jgi:purine-binding chemotaxis protein CheW
MTEAYVIFELGQALYGIRSRDVHHLDTIDHASLAEVSTGTSTPWGSAVTASGAMLPALDLRKSFGMAPAPRSARTRLIVVSVGGRQRALIVDAAREFRVIASDAIRSFDAAVHGAADRCISGVTSVKEQLVFILDVRAVLECEEAATIGELAASSAG